MELDESVLDHITQFTYGEVTVDLVRNPTGNYWTLRWGGSRWSKEHQCFLGDSLPSSRTDEYIEDTRYTLEEALDIVTSRDLLKEHEAKCKELTKQ